MAQPRVRKFLDLSTAHLPKHLINGPCPENVIRYPTDYGCFVWVPGDPKESSEAMEEPVPPEILAVQVYARSLGCDYILFDADGDVDDTLPTFGEHHEGNVWQWRRIEARGSRFVGRVLACLRTPRQDGE
jgi:hypothetical protein